MKNKKCLLLMLVALAACSSPFTPDEKETGEFTINVNANTSRAVTYPPSTADIAALKFVFHFTPQGSGTAKDFTVEKSSTTKGKVDAGHYKVTMDVYDLEDATILYARGVADNNPVEIKAGVTTTINIDAYKAADAAPPVISAQPEGAAYYEGETAAALTVAADAPSDGGTLKYQWYSNTANNNTGGNAIPGETAASYIPPTAANAYYYAMVINEKGGSQTSIPSKAATVTVTGLGSGTQGDPFKVHDAVTLQRVGKGTGSWTGDWSLGAYYSQVRNIDLTSVLNWTPIGTTSAPFTGNYDGNGHTISKLTITSATAAGVGLFCYIGSSAIVKNVGIVSCNINVAFTAVGGLAGRNDGTVEYCYSTGTVIGTSGVGGLVGTISVATGKVQNCYSACDVTGTSGAAGGVAGTNSGTVQNCYATGNVTGTIAGGVVGGNTTGTTGPVKNCYATGNVTSSSSIAGGVVGACNGDSTVENCVALNPNVSGGTANYVARVLGTSSASGGGSIASGYGRSDMQVNGSTLIEDNSGYRNGMDIASAQWGNASWWTTTVGFNTSVWHIVNGSLPKLNGMSGGLEAQNPVIIN